MSQMKLFPITIIIFLVVIVFTGINLVGSEISDNENLDNRSKVLIANINSELNNNFDDLSVTTSNLSINGSNEGQDPFALSYLESKQETSKIEGITNKVLSVPDLLLLSVNDDLTEEELSTWKVIMFAFLTLVLIVAAFVALFGDGRIT